MRLVKLLSQLSIGRLLVLAVLITVAYYFNNFDNGENLNIQITAAEAGVSAERSRRTEIEKTMKKKEEMEGSLKQLERDLDIVKSKIPNELKDTQMTSIINTAALASGITVLDISGLPKAVFNAAAIDKQNLRPEDLVEEVKFRILISGTYDGLLKFLDGLAKEEKVIKVRNFTIEKSSSSIDDDSVTFKSEIVGFKQSALAASITPPAPAPVPPPAPAPPAPPAGE